MAYVCFLDHIGTLVPLGGFDTEQGRMCVALVLQKIHVIYPLNHICVLPEKTIQTSQIIDRLDPQRFLRLVLNVIITGPVFLKAGMYVRIRSHQDYPHEVRSVLESSLYEAGIACNDPDALKHLIRMYRYLLHLSTDVQLVHSILQRALDDYLHRECERRMKVHMAIIIQRTWRQCVANPYMLACQRRLRHEFEDGLSAFQTP